MIYLTPFDPVTLLCTGPSTDSGFESLDQAAETMGPPVQRLRRMVQYHGFCFTDYVLRIEE